MQSLEATKKRVFESNLGIVEVSCPWCVHKHPFGVELIVDEDMIAEMFYKIKHAYERILYLQNYDRARIYELTKLDNLIIPYHPKAAKPAPVEVPKPEPVHEPEPACTGETSECVSLEQDCSVDSEDSGHCIV